MRIHTASEARRHWAAILGHVYHTAEHVIILRNGRQAAGLVHPDDVIFLERLADEADIDEARQALLYALGTESIAWPDLRRDLDMEE